MNLVVPKKSKNPEYAIEFAVYLTNYENQLKLSKLATILPVNTEALNDNYFKQEKQDDIYSKARVTSAKQLNNLQRPIPICKNQKELLSMANDYIQKIILGKDSTQNLLDNFSAKWKKLNNCD